jgi:starvation-inducible DNA-binding protein
MYKKHHWQVSGPASYRPHLLFDKHYGERIQTRPQALLVLFA